MIGLPLPAATGSCFGFEIRSELRFEYLRSGGTGRLVIHEGPTTYEDPDPSRLIVEWRPTPLRPLRAKLYELGGVYRLWIDGGGWYEIRPGQGEIVVPSQVDPLRREERLWGLPSALCFLARGDRSLHAAAVEVEGGVVLLAGPSRHGKTTLAAGFLAGGFRLLAEDLSCYRMGESPVLYPGPAMLRIRRDVADQITLSGVHQVASDEDRAHLSLADEWRGTSDPLPIKAIVFLKDDAHRIELTPVEGTMALPDLWLLSLHLPNDDDRAVAFESISALADAVPIFDLIRPTTISALPDVVGAVVERVTGREKTSHW